MRTLQLSWTPGRGGLVAELPPGLVPTVMAEGLGAGARVVQPLHVTLLRTASMAPLVPVLGPAWPELRGALPAFPAPHLLSQLHRAERPPHPEKDPPGATAPRTTWFLVPADPAPLRAALADIVAALDAASRARGGPTFPHPEPERFFHVSLFNDRGGDARRSIGDIGPGDVRGPGVG
jgi:hypothetical protein